MTPKNSRKKGLICPKGSPKLTPAEKEVLCLLTDEFLTIKQISIRRKCTVQAVYKIVRKLKQKGAYDLGFNRVEKIQSTMQPLNQIRLHGQEWNVKILYKDENYQKALQKANTLRIDGNTIRLYRNSLEIYSGQSFFAEDEQKAMSESIKYWNRFFARLEHELKVILVKPRAQNVSLVNQHFGETNSELAEDCINRAERIKIYTREDGKLWFTIDNSFNFKERECLHPATSKQDSEKVTKHIQDWRDSDPPTISEVMKLMRRQQELMTEHTELNKETAAGLLAITDYMKNQIPKKYDLDSQIKSGSKDVSYIG